MLDEIKEIAGQKGQTFQDVARQIGVSRFTLYRVANSETVGSRDFWNGMIEWSGGKITPDRQFAEQIQAASRADA